MEDSHESETVRRITPIEGCLKASDTTPTRTHGQASTGLAFFVPNPPNNMAIKLSANYSKKLGLPNYSSHSFSASVEIELTDISQVESEVKKLYELLQHSVDQEIQHPGFVPQGDGSTKPQPTRTYQLNGRQQNGTSKPIADRWNCTDGQKGFILRILNENNLDKQAAEDLSQQLFGIGIKEVNKLQASQLIDDLLVRAGKPARQTRWQSRPTNHAA